MGHGPEDQAAGALAGNLQFPLLPELTCGLFYHCMTKTAGKVSAGCGEKAGCKAGANSDLTLQGRMQSDLSLCVLHIALVCASVSPHQGAGMAPCPLPAPRGWSCGWGSISLPGL